MIYNITQVLVYSILYYYSTTLHYYTTALLHHCTTTPLHYYPPTLLHYYIPQRVDACMHYMYDYRVDGQQGLTAQEVPHSLPRVGF